MAPNLPLLSVVFDPQAGPPNVVPGTAVALDTGDGRGVTSAAWKRGRQYELGQAQAGTCTVVVSDPLETLNPANTSSPLNSGGNTLAPFRSVGIRAWWPRSGNMLDARNYTSFLPGFEAVGVTNGWTSASAGTAITNSTTAPFEGTRCLQLVLGGSAATALAQGGAGYLTIPGQTHTYSVWVRRDSASTGSTISVTATPGTGAVTSSSTSSTSFVRLSVTFTATAARTPITLNITGGPAGSGAQKVYIDAEQLEPGPTATTYSAVGMVRYSRFTGYVERYPQTWVDAGFRGVRPLEAVDALSPLSRAIIRASYDAEIALDNPSLYLPLDDAAGPGVALGPLSGSVQLAEFIAPNGGSIGWGGDTQPDGTKAVTLAQQLQKPADTALNLQYTQLDTRSPVGPSSSDFAINTSGMTFEFWARIPASRAVYVALASVQDSNFTDPGSTDVYYGLRFFSPGILYMTVFDRTAFYGQTVTGGGYPDDQWHYYAISLRPSVGTPANYGYEIRTDGTDVAGDNVGVTITQVGINSLHLDARTLYGDPVSKIAIGRVAVYGSNIGSARRAAHYQRGIGYLGELTDARCTRLLTAYWGGPVNVAPGSGLALAPDFGYDGGSLLAALQDITGTDEGLVYADGAGTVQVEARRTRYTAAAAPVAVLGENTAGGELPYLSLEYDYDPTYVYSEADLDRPGNSTRYSLVNAATEAAVGQRVFSKTLQVASDFDVRQGAVFYGNRYASARLRIRKVTVDPASNPALWPFVLGAEISQRVTVKRRTSQGTVISGDYYLESIDEQVDAAASTWTASYELSPVFTSQPWILGDAAFGVLGSTTVPVY